MIYKGSGSIFKQLMMLLSRCKHRKALSFIYKMLHGLIDGKEKVARACQLLFTMSEDDFKLYDQTVRQVLSNRLEINNNFINTLLNTVITLPEKYMLTKHQIDTFGLIDFEGQKGQLQKLYHLDIYLPSTKDLNGFLVETIKTYLECIEKPVESEQDGKDKN